MNKTESIQFVCPRCDASHDRGFVDGVDTFRCLGCGYVGHGWHPDADIDAGMHEEFLTGQQLDAAAGLTPQTHTEALSYQNAGPLIQG